MRRVDPQLWPSRRRMAAAQLRRGALDAPWPQASWFSVARRSLVVTGFLVFALATGRLESAVFAAFGALQIGLGEAVLPLRALLRQSVLSVLGLIVVAYAAMTLSGTWWTVPLLAVVAFVQGASSTVGPIPRSVGIGALAMGVIFAGIRADPAIAVTWLAIGAATQSCFAILFWRTERRRAVHVLLANSVRSAERISSAGHISGRNSNAASAEIDQAMHTIDSSGVPNRQAAVAVAEAVNQVRRNLVAWREIERPGLAERLRISGQLRHCIRALSGRQDAGDASAPGETWPVGSYLATTIGNLRDAIAHLPDADDRPRPVPETSNWGDWHGFRVGTSEFRHGMRMAFALALAQSLALVLPLDHSFWIPLTCVFVVKPDWAFTIIRSLARVGGNLLAVLLVPAITYAAGDSVWGISVAVLIVSAVAFRYFTGTYILGSFGIAGTILILDFLLADDANLYVSRIIATLVGAAVGIVTVAILPAWRSGQAIRLVDETVRGLADWARAVTYAVLYPAAVPEVQVRALAEAERANLIRLRPAVDAAIVEPWPAADPRCLAVIVDAASRAHLCLLALMFEADRRRALGEPGLDVGIAARSADTSFQEAVVLVGGEPRGYPLGVGPSPESPRSEPEIAVTVEVVRLQQAATDLAAAVALVKRVT